MHPGKLPAPLQIQILSSIPSRVTPASCPAFQDLFPFLSDPYQEWKHALEKVTPLRLTIYSPKVTTKECTRRSFPKLSPDSFM